MAGISLNSILQVKPNTWTPEVYTGKNCVTVEVGKCSTEYTEIENELRLQGIDASISQIKRVQHPFAYGRLLIRKDQLERRNGVSYETTRKFYRVLESEVEEALEYNLDNRRTSSIGSLQSGLMLHDNCCVIITQRLIAYSSKTRDSEEYPEYVIYFV